MHTYKIKQNTLLSLNKSGSVDKDIGKYAIVKTKIRNGNLS